jgi:uncharacterized protein YjiS (DUF1127 family)
MSTQELECGEDSGALVPGASARAALARARQKIWASIAGYIYRRALRRAESELMMLDDRALRDIGMTRSEIPAAVRRANATLLTPIVP